ncbi:MAG: hypothetical protein IJY93_00045 [Clostridia bacterium]|nr:hypothetical protein [Clostridia bacterium]
MTIEKVLRLADEIKPNALSQELKIHYISEAEGLIQSDVMLIASPDIVVYGVDDLSAELLVRPPHDKLYLEYLIAMIDFANGEYNRYTNTITRFNTDLAAYTAWYASRFHPIDGRVEEAGYYLSAYAIAVAHGFDGSEAQWLESLRGPAGKGDPGDDGKTAEFRYSGDVLQWKYTDEGDEAWRVLVDVAEISAYADSAAESARKAAESAGSIGNELALANEAAERAAESADAAAKSAQDAVGAAGGGVSTFNGRSGIVVPQKEDYQEYYAEKNHVHDGYAESGHNHDDVYAAKGHSHDGYALSPRNYTVSIASSAWTGDSSTGYSQTVKVEGITEDDMPFADVVLGEDIATNESALDAWACITRITTGDGTITLWANKKVPTSDFSIRLKVVR